MFRILHCGRAVLQRATVVSNTLLTVPTSSKCRWQDSLYVGSRTKVHNFRKPKFVRYNLQPKISASYVNFFTQSVHNVEGTINQVVLEKVREMMVGWDFDIVEKQILQELYNGTVNLDVVFYVVKLMLDKNYLPQDLINGVFDLSLDNLNDVVHNHDQAAELMLMAFICSSKVPDAFLLAMQNYLHRNIQKFHIKHIKYFYLAFQKCKWVVTNSLNQSVVNIMLKNMLTLHHNDILNVFKSLMVSNYYDKNGVEKIAESLLENNKILSLISDQHLQLYIHFFISRHYYQEALYDSFLQNFNFLVSNMKITNIKATSFILSSFGTIQFKPKNKVYREICTKLEKICLDTQYKPAYFSNNDEWIPEFVNGMIFFGFFSDDLLSKVFSSIDRLPDNKLKRQQILFIHYSMLIEHPEYNGSLLPSQLIKDMQIDSTERFRWERRSDKARNLETIYDVLCDMLGQDYVHWYHILPHFTYSDIEIRLKKDGSVVAFEPETYLQRVNSELDKKASPGVTKVIIMHLNENSFLNGSPELKGRSVVKIRQLQILGYHILTIAKDELRVLPTQKERIDFMTELIENNFDVKLKLPEVKRKMK
ncbi:hypothetical protein LOTGIDRAFT_230645 [Lottia gigantea]|uniref:RAP domain-containing protein n=1 Tax=Lottia gigantea TaxID=225164 RepID=V4B5J6_LOTGI|nr:hypothetical protein LOTGIDRAFT_230645 [Lottia gigantea]ESP01287.1 hypothetical protein LOTGIDRAFT_230645 [Lottia gigantea]